MLRKRSLRKYDETEPAEDEIEAERKFDLEQPLNSKRFEPEQDQYLHFPRGDAFTLSYIQRNGFDKPILIEEPKGLDLRMPPSNFLIRDIRNAVGPDRIVDVMDVKTQKNVEMTMKDWCKYYESGNREKLLNVISLEVSCTKLDQLVESPLVVKQLDWVDLVWPKHLKLSQTDPTNKIDRMKYPKVQKYCLMSVRGAYTDFHIDFGGTSVWYHILRGHKVFWMVPPTELNLQAFQEWTFSGQQHDVFFGDTVGECFRIELTAPQTFFIPSGWIHAVFTAEDSLVFGGNFLHSFAIESQLKMARLEDSIKVPVKFRYPFYTETLWYVVQHYVHCLSGKNHRYQDTRAICDDKIVVEKQKKVISIKKQDAQNNNDDDDTDIDVETSNDNNTKSNNQKSRGETSKTASSRRNQSKINLRGVKKRKIESSLENDDEDDDDDSTDIDSGNESPTKVDTSSTCRMTKNSLSRLQYEIDWNSEEKKDSSKSKSSNCPIPYGKKKKLDESEQEKELVTEKENPSTNTLIEGFSPSKMNGWSGQPWSKQSAKENQTTKIHITQYELSGLKALVKHLSKLTGAKKNLPSLIKNSKSLLDDCKKLIVEHEDDDAELAVTGLPITQDMLVGQSNDMNELIDQFFKPNQEKLNETSDQTFVKTCKKQTNCISNSEIKNEETSAHKTKKAKTEGREEKISSNSSDNLKTSPKVSFLKETKCLSLTKKDKISTSMSHSSSEETTPPTRPLSPPTRPISNNQYCGKTKKLLGNIALPGSFADLIAATSSENKTFDVLGPNESTTLFPGTTPTKSTLANSTTSSSSSSTISGDKIVSPKSKEVSFSESNVKTKTQDNSSNIRLKQEDNTFKNQASIPQFSSQQSAFQKRSLSPSTRPISNNQYCGKTKKLLGNVTLPGSFADLIAATSSGNKTYDVPKSNESTTIFSGSNLGRNTSANSSTSTSSPSSLTVSSNKIANTKSKEVSFSESNIKTKTQDNIATSCMKQTNNTFKPLDGTKKSALPNPQKRFINPNSSAAQQQNKEKLIFASAPYVAPAHLTKNKATYPWEAQLASEARPSQVSSNNNSQPVDATSPPKPVVRPVVPTSISSQLVRHPKPVATTAPINLSQIQQLNGARFFYAATPQQNIAPVTTTSSSKLASTSATTAAAAAAAANQASSSKAKPTSMDNTALLSLATTALSATPIMTNPALNQIAPHVGPAIMVSSAGNHQQAFFAGQQFYRPFIPRYSFPQNFVVAQPVNAMSHPPPPRPVVPTSTSSQLVRHPTPVVATAPINLAQLQHLNGARFFYAATPQQNITPVTTVATSSGSKLVSAASASQASSSKSTPTSINNAALLSLATTALSATPIMTNPALNQIAPHVGPTIMVSSAGNHQQAFLAGQQFYRPFIPRYSFPQNFVVAQQPTVSPVNQTKSTVPIAGIMGAPASVAGVRPATAGSTGAGQLLFAQLPNQAGPRFFITSPFKQPGFPTMPTAHLVAGQSSQNLTLAKTKNRNEAKQLKQKKVAS